VLAVTGGVLPNFNYVLLQHNPNCLYFYVKIVSPKTNRLFQNNIPFVVFLQKLLPKTLKNHLTQRLALQEI